MNSDLKTRSPMLAKILGPETAQALEDETQEPLRETRPAVPAPMLDLVLKSGHVESFGYAYLTRVSFDPRGRLLLYFGEDVAILEGRNLDEIRQKIRMHRASEILEGLEAEDALKPEDAAHVERIGFTTREEMEALNHDTGRRKSALR